MDAVYSCRYSFIRRLFLPITLSQKGRICRKCTSKPEDQARQQTFASDKTKAGAAGMKPENNQVKRIEKEEPG
ncbi:hypothetical protein NXX83_21935 [Bacteroides thetaiotaomicron]|nr:hypothetical protein NXX83_21935 [Bacteroides thetaiotaomicron]